MLLTVLLLLLSEFDSFLSIAILYCTCAFLYLFCSLYLLLYFILKNYDSHLDLFFALEKAGCHRIGAEV